MIKQIFKLRLYVLLFSLLHIQFSLQSQPSNEQVSVVEKQSKQLSWWQQGIIYEIYLRSFQDSNGDGIGDLKGVEQRLDYLEWLGVKTLWLTPFYPSPMKDFGYDVSDYKEVDPRFGTMEDFDHLVKQIHAKGMKVMIDMVPNHTSDQHPWFKESKSSKDNPKRNWYYWQDAKNNGAKPNNWKSVLGGDAWEWDATTQQYYYHAFLKEQPDLNLRNPEVVEAVLDVMKFWLDKGVDGFRVDVMWHLMKDELWRDNPPNPKYIDTLPDSDRLLQLYSCDQPEVHGLIQKMRDLLDKYNNKMMLGEIYLPLDRVVTYYGQENEEAHLPANFQLMFAHWKAPEIRGIIDKYEALLPNDAWPNWVIGNHDRPRLINRIGREQAKIAALLLLTLRGTPILYYGDEIGMQQVAIPKNEIQDPQGLLMPGKNLSRDPQRTPMQWSSSTNAGFSTGKPWLRLADDFKTKNVENEKNEVNSLLNYYKRLINYRQKEDALLQGHYIPVYSDKYLLSYIRKIDQSGSLLIIANLTSQKRLFNPKNLIIDGTVEFSTAKPLEGKSIKGPVQVAPNQGLIIRLQHTER